ncbi:hypothetical protein PAXRUDRAFT_178955 [Paxillus rubicundulus Ve08.2h10]|uniref:Uncharacterized protein n=1 Tax=Paxillus rubicundulus Ve08.2h10 TaxID=930991 RepID=A0A0D0CQY6_9AGAM|nr:hypothetical protein PAXRUDRAFT_178955 [Paxillus rubicundulus Ve08.2h10]
MFDQLLTVRHYNNLDLVLPTLQLRLDYLPGTVVAFLGKLLVHGAGEMNGDRACIVWYMQDKVHQAMNVGECGYCHLDDVERK